MSETILKKEERVAFALRTLYQQYGYLSYKMSKFEEYDLYVENKDFLVGEGVITFNDTNGKLLALKPDVTLSIIKNDGDEQGKRKVCYNENVYRISDKTKQFKEIMQVGLECIGDIDVYDVYETLYLAASSLAAVSDSFVLDISHLGVISSVLENIGGGEKFSKELMKKIAEKNVHEIDSLCEKYAVSKENKTLLKTLAGTYGEPEKVFEKLLPICVDEKTTSALNRLKEVWSLLKETEHADKIRIDFSVVNDMNYYNDIVFKGFIDGIAEGVLSGGRYDKMLSRMGRKSGGIGFAVYADLLEGFGEEKTVGVDALVLYDDETLVETIAKTTRALIKEGKSVKAQKTTGGARYKTLVDLTGGVQ